MRPITRDTGRVLCEANVLYRGRKQATAEANLTAADSGKLLAHGTATCMILDLGSISESEISTYLAIIQA